MFEMAVVGDITWVDLGGLVVAITALFLTIFGMILGVITKIMFGKLDTMSADISITKNATIESKTHIEHLQRQHEECSEDRGKLHSRITTVQGGN